MITGENLIDGTWVGSPNMLASPDLPSCRFAQATAEQVDNACFAARRDFRTYAATSSADRAQFLRAIAEEIEASLEEVIKTAMEESGLPEARLKGEGGRTTGQLRAFADLIEDSKYLDIRIVPQDLDRKPLPRPDLRLMHRPIGPVVVFGASNFPLAFSTAGGDTASALAAGCPVIVKGHAAHAGTTELVGRAIVAAMKRCNMPAGTFQFLQGSGREVGSALVQHPDISAVGFTGSTTGGRALYDQCHARPNPIPFYGELGSINPMFCLPEAVAARAETIGRDWAASVTAGAGQFCTNPGVVIALKGDNFTALQNSAVDALHKAPLQKMLTDGILAAYREGVQAWGGLAELLIDRTESKAPRSTGPAVFRTDGATWINTPKLHDEVFGAAGLFVECETVEQMFEVAEKLQGQLTCTLQIEADDYQLATQILPILEEKAGRILCNNFPTGVEVSPAMMHGGPYPASTDSRSTSVGTLAIDRWLRPVCFQNFPTELLSKELQNL